MKMIFKNYNALLQEGVEEASLKRCLFLSAAKAGISYAAIEGLHSKPTAVVYCCWGEEKLERLERVALETGWEIHQFPGMEPVLKPRFIPFT